MPSRVGIPYDHEQLEELCRESGIRRLRLFGSVLRADFGPDSDVDVLVEFEAGATPGFLALWEIEQRLSTIFGGRPVDLVTEASLSPRLRPIVVAEAEVRYAA